MLHSEYLLSTLGSDSLERAMFFTRALHLTLTYAIKVNFIIHSPANHVELDNKVEESF